MGKYGALGNALGACACNRGVIMERHEAGSVGKVGQEPTESSNFDIEVSVPEEQDIMGHGTKGST